MKTTQTTKIKYTLIYDKGCGGSIYKIYDKHKKPYVLKIPKKTEKGLNFHNNEVYTLLKLKHPNIIKLIKCNNNCLVTEFANGGDLFHWIHPIYGINLNSENVRAIIKPIINALIYTNTMDISHRDIKLENIVIHDGIPKLIDWGFACKNNILSKVGLGTDIYMSIQILQKKIYHADKNDIWSLGVVIFLLRVQTLPYNESTIDKIDDYLQAIIDFNWDMFWKSHVNYNQECKILNDHDFRDLIQNMLNPDENKRFNLQQVLNHNWFKQKSSTQQEIQQLQKKVITRKNYIIKIQSIYRGYLVRKKRLRVFSK